MPDPISPDVVPSAVSDEGSRESTDGALDRICYKRNFLTEVITRADFVTPLPGLDSKLPPALTDVAMKQFPIFEPQSRLERQFEMKPVPGQITTKERSYTDWAFHGKNREKSVTLSQGCLIVRYTKYTRFEDLSADFSAVFNAVCTSFPDSRVGRLGLRYINTLDFEQLRGASVLDWSKYLHADLLGLFRFVKDSEDVSRVFHNIEYTYDDAQLRYQFGMHNPDYPARIRRHVFILDFDAFAQGLIEAQEVQQRLLRFHGLIQALFERSILEPLREQLNA
jgi:uncharacterized protein (TIGR04255 family)